MVLILIFQHNSILGVCLCSSPPTRFWTHVAGVQKPQPQISLIDVFRLQFFIIIGVKNLRENLVKVMYCIQSVHICDALVMYVAPLYNLFLL